MTWSGSSIANSVKVALRVGIHGVGVREFTALVSGATKVTNDLTELAIEDPDHVIA